MLNLLITSGDLLSNPAEATSETGSRGYSPLAADPWYGWQGARLCGRTCLEQRGEVDRGWDQAGRESLWHSGATP